MPIKKDLKACIQRNGPANSAVHVYALEWMAGKASSLQTKKNSMLPRPYMALQMDRVVKLLIVLKNSVAR